MYHKSTDVYVCSRGVYVSQASAVRALEASRRRVSRPSDVYEEQYREVMDGKYLPARFVSLSRHWTRAALERREA